MIITSLQNPTVKETIKLRNHRDREERGVFLIEGYRELKRAVDAGWKIETLFYSPDWFLGEKNQDLIEQAKCPTQECSREVFAKLSYRDRPDGLLAVAPQVHLGLNDLSLKKTPFLLIAESIEKPGNLGTMLRSCDAAGVDAVLLCDPTTDLYNPNVVRSSVGTLFTLPIIEAATSEVIPFLKKHGITIVAATPRGTCEFTKANFQVPLAIAMGTEQYGLTEFWIDHAEVQVQIPMFGVADSLNVASATTLLLYEVIRQRGSSLLR